jgi:Na+/proline symporter
MLTGTIVDNTLASLFYTISLHSPFSFIPIDINWFIIGIAISLIAYLLIGNYMGTLVEDIEDYYVAGRNAPTLLIVGSLIASFLSTVTFLGEAAFTYSGYPIPLLILVVLNASGYMIGAIFFGRYIARLEPLTLPEYFGIRFDSDRIRIISALTLIVGITVYLVAVTQGLTLLFSEVTGLSFPISLLIIIFLYLSFTFYAGSEGVLITDTIMFLVFTAAVLLSVPFVVMAAGGWPTVIHDLASYSARSGILTWHGITGEAAFMGSPPEVLAWAIILGFVWGAVVAISPWQTSRYIMAKNEHVIVRSGIASMVILLVIEIAFHLFTMPTIALINPGIKPAEQAYIWAAQNVLPTALGVIVVAGILAAGLSSCSTFLSLVGFSLSRDIIEQIENPYVEQFTEDENLSLSRGSMLVVGFVVLVITYYQPPAVLWIGYFAGTLFAASWTAVGFLSVHSKNMTEFGAVLGMTLGFIGTIFFEGLGLVGVSLPIYLHPVILGFILSLIGIAIGNYRSNPTETERERRMEMIEAVGDVQREKANRTLTYGKILPIAGIVIFCVLFIFYYAPYIGII